MSKMFLVFLFVFGLLAFLVWFRWDMFSGFFPKAAQEEQASVVDVATIEPAELAAKIAGGDDFILLDVRTRREYEAEHIEGAVLIPLDQLDARYTELPLDEEIILYCRSGRRSLLAGTLLWEKGFRKLKNLEGGMRQWCAAQPEETCRVCCK
ncbi:MAG: rhodanese-like domain-containing protein [Bdellovibrionales bacterium]